MITRTDLNNGLDALSLTALSISGAVNGAFFAVGHTSGTKGSTLNIPIHLYHGNSAISALQFDLLLPSGITFISALIGPAGNTAGKGLVSNPVAGGIRFLLAGLNQNVLGDGVLLTLQASLASSVTTKILTFGLNTISASDPSGNAVSLNGLTGTVTVL